MSYYIILDKDGPPGGGNFTYVASNPSIAPLRQQTTFDPTSRTTVPANGRVFSFMEDHAMHDSLGAPVPAKIYHA